jgi:hypothetical protein
MIRASVLALAILPFLAACGAEASGRQPPHDVPEGDRDVAAEMFACGQVPFESVWYPPTGAIIVGDDDAILAPRTRFGCPGYGGSGTHELSHVMTTSSTVDIYIEGADNDYGVSELSASVSARDFAPVTIDAVELEPQWYRVEVPQAADSWVVRLDMVTHLEWEASYSFKVTARG